MNTNINYSQFASKSPPVSPPVGCMWYDTTKGQVKVWQGQAWFTVTEPADPILERLNEKEW